MRNLVISITPPLLIKFYRQVRSKPKTYRSINLKAINGFALDFKVLEFKLVDVEYKFDYKWGWWSRVYEYELVLQKLRDLNNLKQTWIHNTCWGYQGCHILFKTELESEFSNVINSDIQRSPIENTEVYNLKTPPPSKWEEKFDFVLNVSTIEEIDYPHIQIFENLLRMVKKSGYLIATFDLPGMQLDMFEKLFDQKIRLTSNPVTGKSSPYRMDQFEHLKVGYFVIQRL